MEKSEWLFNVTEQDPEDILYDHEYVNVFVTCSEESADKYNENCTDEEDEIYPDDIGSHIDDVRNVIKSIGGDGSELMECLFTVPKNNRTVSQIIEEVQQHGWTLDTSLE